MSLKVGYFAHGSRGNSAFEKIINDKNIEILFICDRYKSTDERLKKHAKTYHIDYLEHKDINSKEFIAKISKYNCDIFASMYFDQIFKSQLINLPKYNIINCHAGKLPFYRGCNILDWVLINDEKEFSISVHFVDEGIDTGDIILQKAFPIKDEDTYISLLEKSYIKCADILHEALLQINNKTFKRVKQSTIHPLGFYCTKRKQDEYILNWDQKSRDIFNFIRSCGAIGGALATLNQHKMIIKKAKFLKEAPLYKCSSGSIVGILQNSFLVKTKDSFIQIIEYEYSKRLKIGDKFE